MVQKCGIIHDVKKQKDIFLDYASITPLDKNIEKEMQKVQNKFWANPSSIHTKGEQAKDFLEQTRKDIARTLHAKSSEIYFTSGGTESLNTAIFGVVEAYRGAGVPHIIVSSIEHPAILEPIKQLSLSHKIEVSFVSPQSSGIIKPESIKKEIKQNTVLVILQHANNEIGTIQPISKVAGLIKEYRNQIQNKDTLKDILKVNYPYLLVDASQSVLYEQVSLERLQADMIVIDGIKMYGPRSSGVLVLRHGLEIKPILYGGGQESGLRSGTESVANAYGMKLALDKAVYLREKESNRLTKIRDYCIQKILQEIKGSSLNGDSKLRLPNNINICFADVAEDIDSEFLVIKLDTKGISASPASACHTRAIENSSYVVASLGYTKCASASVRFTLGRDTKKADIDYLIKVLKDIFIK